MSSVFDVSVDAANDVNSVRPEQNVEHIAGLK